MHKNQVKLPMDIQGDVHQAVDVAFSIADLIGSLFSTEFTPERRGKAHHHILGGTINGPQVALLFDGTKGVPPCLQCTGNAAAVVTVTSPVPLTAEQAALPSTPLPLFAQSIYVPQNGTVPLTNFAQMTRGIFTAALVPVADPGYPVILLGANGRTLLNHQAQLTSDMSLTANSAGVTLTSIAGAPYSIALNLTSSAPERSVSHAASIPEGENSVTIPLDPEDMAASAISAISYVISGPFSMLPSPPSDTRYSH